MALRWLSHTPRCGVLTAHRFSTCSKLRKEDNAKAANATLQSIDNLGGPIKLPIIGSFWLFIPTTNFGRLHEIQIELVKKHGKIMKLDFLGKPFVAIADPQLLQEYQRQEEKFPQRLSPGGWLELIRAAGQNPGLVVSQGADWNALRKSVQTKMMRSTEIAVFDEQFAAINRDFIKRLSKICDANGFVPGLLRELNKWSFEGICAVIYDERIGCLEDEVSKDYHDFIDSIGVILSSPKQLVGLFPNVHKALNTGAWRKTLGAWEKVFNMSEKCLKNKENSVKMKPLDETAKKTLLDYLLFESKLSRPDVLALLTEFMMAAVDTTSNSVGFTFFNLANNPQCQAKLYAEIRDIVKGGLPTAEHLKRMPYLKFCVKESQRLFPAAVINTRMLESDVILNNYLVPKKTSLMFLNYAIGHNPDYFELPDDFIPERWDRKGAVDITPYANVPFGVGVRSCIGRRIAEMEMQLLLIQILQEFEIRPHANMDFTFAVRTVLTPDRLPIELHKRRPQS